MKTYLVTVTGRVSGMTVQVAIQAASHAAACEHARRCGWLAPH